MVILALVMGLMLILLTVGTGSLRQALHILGVVPLAAPNLVARGAVQGVDGIGGQLTACCNSARGTVGWRDVKNDKRFSAAQSISSRLPVA
jgi:hypothetical protein